MFAAHRGCEYKISVFDSFETQQVVGDLFYARNRTVHDNYLQTIIMIDMHVRCRNDILKMIMLQFREISLKITPVMVVYECQHTDTGFVSRAYLLLDNRIANDIANSFRAVAVSFFGNERIEVLEKIVLHRNAEAGEFGHDSSVTRFFKR